MKNPPTGSAGGVGKREYVALALTKKEQSELSHCHQCARPLPGCQRLSRANRAKPDEF